MKSEENTRRDQGTGPSCRAEILPGLSGRGQEMTSPKQVFRDTQNTTILTHLGFTHPNSS